MSRRLSLATVVIASAAIAAAGCGSSSSSKSNATPAATPPATTPTAPSTPSTGTGTAPSAGNVMGGTGASTPIGSPAIRALLIKKISEQPSFPKDKDAPWADCVIKKLEAAGLKTAGEAAKQPDQIRNAGATCAKQVVLGQK